MATNSSLLVWRAYVQYEKAKIYDIGRWASQVGRCPICYWERERAAAAKLLQSCLTLCDPIDGSPPGSPVPGILQARTPEWVVISFSSAWKWKVKSLSQVRLFTTSWTVAYQAPPSMGFSRQEYWSGLPFPSPFIHNELLQLKNKTNNCIF